jgi:hypothetical protein
VNTTQSESQTLLRCLECIGLQGVEWSGQGPVEDLRGERFDIPMTEARGILGSTKPLNLDTLQCLDQRWDSPQALIRVCPTLFALVRVLFGFEAIYFKNLICLDPLNLLPTARKNLEQCSRTA